MLVNAPRASITSDETTFPWRAGLHEPDRFADFGLGVQLHDGQRAWLRNATTGENCLVTGNRWGKSFVSAVKAIHRAIYRPRKRRYDRSGRYRILIASITQDQANRLWREARRLIDQSPVIAPLVVDSQRAPFPVITFGNGATIEARSTQNRGEYLLGNDFDLIIFDEVAFETDPEYVVDEVLTMRLADRDGQLDLVSTPNGRNWFYLRCRDIERRRRPGYLQFGDSRDNQFIARSFLDDRMATFSPERIQQNIMGQFVDSGGEILRGSYVDRAMARRPPAPISEEKSVFLTGWDLARKRTATVGITVTANHGSVRVVALERLRRLDWAVVTARIAQRQQWYPGRLTIDGTGLGDVVVEQLANYRPESVIFTPATKAALLTHLELLHARDRIAYDRWELPDGPGRIWSLEDELRRARWDDNNDCDGVMALALAVWPLRHQTKLTPPPRFTGVQ